MDPDKENANPTILNLSDLPSRRRASSTQHKARVNGGTGLFDALVPAYGYPYDPFALAAGGADARQHGGPDGHVWSGDASSTDSSDDEQIDEQEVYDLISTIADPEHPLSLGSLAVVNLPDIRVTPPARAGGVSTVAVDITPTITHCSLATVIGLGVRVRLEQALPPRFRVDVRVKPGTHSTADAVSKQLADKERVAAALENATLMGVLRKMLSTCE